MDEQRYHQIFVSIRCQANGADNATDAVAGAKGQGGEGMFGPCLQLQGHRLPMLPDVLSLGLQPGILLDEARVIQHRARWPDQQVRRSQMSCTSCRAPVLSGLLCSPGDYPERSDSRGKRRRADRSPWIQCPTNG